jgi:hypothetical protein
MQINPVAEWQRLTQLYSKMGDVELYELHDGIADLTEVAQQVLRDEMRTRGLSRPRAAVEEPKISDYPAAPLWDSNADSPNSEDETEDSDLPHEYTWKTLLCECGDGVEAWQLREALRQAGIESWIEAPGYHVVADMLNPRILVAADQLEQAREIASKPIPQAIVELSKIPDEEYIPPVCPRCGAEDPVLESADPVNSWLCESCGEQWTDPVEDVTETSAR